MTYVEHLLNLDAMREWYEAALKETWRETGHDQDLLNAGKLLSDMRAST